LFFSYVRQTDFIYVRSERNAALTFRPHRSDGFNELAVEPDSFVILGGDPHEVGDVGLEACDLADGGSSRQAGHVCPRLLVPVSLLYDVASDWATAVCRRTRPLYRHRVVGDADQTY